MNFKHKFGWTWTSRAGFAVHEGCSHGSSSWSSFVPIWTWSSFSFLSYTSESDCAVDSWSLLSCLFSTSKILKVIERSEKDIQHNIRADFSFGFDKKMSMHIVTNNFQSIIKWMLLLNIPITVIFFNQKLFKLLFYQIICLWLTGRT